MSEYNNLEKEDFIAGERKELYFDVFDNETKLPQDITLFQCTLKVSPYSDKEYDILTKTGDVDVTEPTTAHFTLLPSDTEEWDEGYYIFHVIIYQGTTNIYKIQGKWLVKRRIG